MKWAMSENHTAFFANFVLPIFFCHTEIIVKKMKMIAGPLLFRYGSARKNCLHPHRMNEGVKKRKRGLIEKESASGHYQNQVCLPCYLKKEGLS